MPTAICSAWSISLVLVALAAWRSRGCTLVAPLAWAAVAISAVSVVEMMAAAGRLQGSEAAWRFVTATLTLCPAMAMLGAKRPQSGPWQAIVASLAIIVLMPSAAALLRNPSQPVELHGVHAGFLWLLIAVGVINWAPTRFFLVAILVAVAQIILLAEQLPLLAGFDQPPLLSPGVAPFLMLAAIVAGWITALWAKHRPRSQPGLDRLWADFRNVYGLVWALRVAERVSVAAELRESKIALGWWGLRPRELNDPSTVNVPTDADEAAMLAAMRGLLRRFVSHEWILDRLQNGKTQPLAPDGRSV